MGAPLRGEEGDATYGSAEYPCAGEDDLTYDAMRLVSMLASLSH